MNDEVIEDENEHESPGGSSESEELGLKYRRESSLGVEMPIRNHWYEELDSMAISNDFIEDN
jgi:hypothetical protein